jgi:cytochrome c-type biogenesis protein CcmE
MQARVVVGAALIFGAMAAVALVSYFANQEAYYTVDELLARTGAPGVALAAEPEAPGPRMQVRGTVDDASVERSTDALELRFALAGKDGTVPVVYEGLVPDTFDLAEQVTVGGRLAADGTFHADQLFVQCPSKYEAAPPGEAGGLGAGGTAGPNG